jgi:hypothetical protein
MLRVTRRSAWEQGNNHTKKEQEEMKKQRLAISTVLFWCVLAVSGAAWCGDNGTVTINGLVWLKDAGCLGWENWDSAMSRPKSLAHGQCGLTDNSKAGDWRLPTVEELRDVYPYKGQFMAVQAGDYWSSSTFAVNAADAWIVHMSNGNVSRGLKDGGSYVLPVRGGQ